MFVQTTFLFVISLSWKCNCEILETRYISRERSGQEEEKTYFILHFKKVVVINVA